MPEICAVFHTFWVGLIAFHLHRQPGGDNPERFKRGKEAMEKMEKWAKIASVLFDNKLLLLKAEHSAAIGEYDQARGLYESSINAAKDHGRIHDLACAYEFL